MMTMARACGAAACLAALLTQAVAQTPTTTKETAARPVVGTEPERLWVARLKSDSDEAIGGLATDSRGNCFVVGSTDGDFATANAGQRDAFVVKLDTNGEEAWRRQLGTEGQEVATTIAAHRQGGYYVSGRTDGDFASANAGKEDAFLVKLDADGAELWRRQFGTSDIDSVRRMAIDTSDNCYVLSTVFHVVDLLVTKYDTEGNAKWRYQLGDGIDDLNDVVLGEKGECYIAMTGPKLLEPPREEGVGTRAITLGRIIKLDVDGSEQWRHTWEPHTSFTSTRIALDRIDGLKVVSRVERNGRISMLLVSLDDRGDAVIAEERLWPVPVDVPYFNVGYDRVGHLYSAGTRAGKARGPDGVSGTDLVIISYSKTGKRRWERSIPLSLTRVVVQSMLVDAVGNTYLKVTGKSGPEMHLKKHDFLVVIDHEGVLRYLWAPSVGEAFSLTHHLALDEAGNLIVAGTVGTDKRDIYVIKYASEDLLGQNSRDPQASDTEPK